MQVALISGIYTDNASDFRTSYPRNLIPVPKQQGVSAGYLRPGYGIVQNGTGPGIDRGGINWNGTLYRVMGTKLVSILQDGTVTTLGDVGGSGQVSLDYSFDRLAIASSGLLYYWNGTTLTQVTDPDLGTVLDVLWVDGYFMTTDGTNIVVTELSDPTQVNPLKYGSSEADPDNVVGLVKIINEVHVINRYTIEVFQNIGGDVFPFQRVDGAQIQKGAVGTYACTVFAGAVAFVGGGRNEAISVYIGYGGQSLKISTREIDQILGEYTEGTLAGLCLETITKDNHSFLLIRLPDRTLVYDSNGSKEMGVPIWFELGTSILENSQYLAQNPVFCYGRINVADPTSTKIGYLTDTISSHWGSEVGWDFGTQILYNEGRGAILHQIELVTLNGRASLSDDPTIWTSYSLDGETWSQEIGIRASKQGERLKRISWFNQGIMENMRMQRFRGTSKMHASFARLEINAESLMY